MKTLRAVQYFGTQMREAAGGAKCRVALELTLKEHLFYKLANDMRVVAEGLDVKVPFIMKRTELTVSGDGFEILVKKEIK